MPSRLPTEPELPLGAHLVTSRGHYAHHGIYVGNGRVVHYAGLCESLRARPVEEVSLERFAAGRGVEVCRTVRARYADAEVVARARSRVGENRYRLLTNNCEHFSTWCLQGASRSTQVRTCLLKPWVGMRVLASLVRIGFAMRYA